MPHERSNGIVQRLERMTASPNGVAGVLKAIILVLTMIIMLVLEFSLAVASFSVIWKH